MRMLDDCRYHLVTAGISMPDADQLRRIAMTLHRWHELECGDSNAYASWCITRGERLPKANGMENFRHDENGKPYLERHPYSGMVAYTLLPDREAGAKKRLASIMARYPGFQAYIPGDPRGASLYILRPGDVREGESVDAVYNRGVAVHK